MDEYKTILIDPPWNERGGGKIVRGAQRHYPLLKTKAMPSVIMESGVWRPADNCHLWCWTTANHLPDALWLIGELGFTYKTNVVWTKPRFGLGQYFRMQHEHLLFAVRGKGFAVKTDARNLASLITAPRRKHSQKPDEAYRLIESRGLQPRLEMFARETRPSWDAWGFEIGENDGEARAKMDTVYAR